MFRSAVWFVIVSLALLGGCARWSDTGKTSLKPKTFGELQGYFLDHKADLAQLRLRGPYDMVVRNDIEIHLSDSDVITADLYLTAHAQKAPLVILLHGLESSKDAHAYQAMHLASWGMHALVPQLPDHGPWDVNGRTLARIVNLIYRLPATIDGRIDVNRIILAGHSYGGAAVAIALAEGAPAVGGILLDPAVPEYGLPGFLRRIDKPVLLLGADRHVSLANNRDYFYRFIRGGIAEVSIKDAAHEDAQYPASFGVATAELQITFASALTAAALSLSATGRFDYAWASFGDVIADGRFIDAKKK